MITRDVCKGCDKERFIVNKKYCLCDDCNYKRTHKGQSKHEVAQGKAPKEREVKKYYIKPKKSEIKVKSALSELKTQIELEAVQNDEYFCNGCGVSYPGLDKSHILSVGQRKDLELFKENIQLMCRTCHMKWESWNIQQMITLHCFERNLEFIKEWDIETYNKLTTKLAEHKNNYFLKM